MSIGNDLAARTWERLRGISHLRSWGVGEVLLHAGKVVHWVVQLQEGELRVARTRLDGTEDLRQGARPGRLLGLTSLIGGRPFPFNVTAAAPCTARLYDGHAVLALMEADSALSLDIARCLARRAGELEAATMDEREDTLFNRVHAALLRLDSLGEGRPVLDGFSLRISQYDLARMVGTSRQYVNQHLKRLQGLGVVRLGYRSIILLDRAPDAVRRAESRQRAQRESHSPTATTAAT